MSTTPERTSGLSVDSVRSAEYCPPLLREPVAQSVEQLTFNQRVVGSNPAGLTKASHYDGESAREPFGSSRWR